MNPGSLDRQIFIRKVSDATTTDDYGVTTAHPGTGIAMRAKLLETTATDTAHESGRVTRTTIAFRLRYLPFVSPGDGLGYNDRDFEITTVKEIGRRRWLEITATERT